MIDITKDILSLSDFQRNAKEHIKRLKKTGRPAVLTLNGRASVVVQDAESYQEDRALMEEWLTVKKLNEGVEAAAQGQTRPFDAFTRDLEAKHKIPARK